MTPDSAGAGPLPGKPRAYSFSEMPQEAFRPGLRRTGIRSDHAIVTLNWFEPDYRSKGQHDHPHDQLAFVLTGSMRFTVGEEEFLLTAPAALHIPAGLPHGAEPVGDEPVLNLDVFAPIRDDFRYLTAYQDTP